MSAVDNFKRIQASASHEVGAAIKLFVIEDDEVDLMGIKRALRDLRITNEVVHARDGVEGLDILRGANGHDPLEGPFIILLDLNMPRMDGIEFLKEIRADETLKSAIVFVLTTSETDQDIIDAYSHNVAGYIVKSDAKEGFREAINLLDLYWTIVSYQTPPDGSGSI